MRKPLLTLLCLGIFVVSAHAQVLFEDSFSTYGTNVLLFDKGDWSCPTNAFTVTTNEIEGTAAWQESTLVGYDFSLDLGDAVAIQIDNVFDISGSTAGMYAGIKNTTANESLGAITVFNSWAGGSIRYYTEFFEWWTAGATSTAAWSNDAGFVVGSDTTTDPMRIIYTVFKSATTYEFNVKVEYENLVSGATGSTTETITNTNLWNAATYELYFGKAHAGLVTYDNYKAEKIPAISNQQLLWEDDFSDAYNGKEIQWSLVWRGNANNAGWEGTNAGYMVQRPTMSTNNTSGNGFRGAVYHGVPFTPRVAETSIVQFDWTLFTYGRENRRFLDIAMTTNIAQWGDNYTFPLDVDSAFTHMGFRIEQSMYPGPLDGQATSNGNFRAIFYQSTTPSVTNFIDPAFLGLAPEDGDNESDPIEVSYSLEKRTVANEWTIYLTMSNETSGATWRFDDIDVVDAGFYAETDFYFASYASSDFASPGTGNHFDNFKGFTRSIPIVPRSGWEQFVIDYGLSGLPYADHDSDGVDDIFEYAFGGVPTNAADLGTKPTIDYGADNNVRHYHYDIQEIQGIEGPLHSGISYVLSKSYSLTNPINIWLVYPNGWNNSLTNHNVATNVTSSMMIIYDEIMCQFWGADLDESFVTTSIQKED